MEGKSYELPDDITGLGGMVTWADKDAEWHTEVFEFLADARYAFREHVKDGDPAYLSRLVALRRSTRWPTTSWRSTPRRASGRSGEVANDPGAAGLGRRDGRSGVGVHRAGGLRPRAGVLLGRAAVHRVVGGRVALRLTRARHRLFDSLPRRFPWASFSHSPSRSCSASASASCAADGGPAPVAPRVPYRPIPRGPRRDGAGLPTSGPYGAAADLAGRRHRSLWRGSALRLRHLVRPSGKGLAHTNERRRPCGCL